MIRKISFSIAAMSMVLLVIVVIFPSSRRYISNSAVGTVIITSYNHARPWLHVRNTRSLVNRLTHTEGTFLPVPNQTNDAGCTLRNAVLVIRSHIPYNHPCLMTGSLAFTMYNFEKEVIQPLAKQYFGQPVVKINHVGTYSCRPIRGYRRLLSEHAYANAIDIRSFQLQDGTLISIQQHWANAGTKSVFLQKVAQRACERFQKVLTPAYDKLHQDHFHLDQGLWKTCG